MQRSHSAAAALISLAVLGAALLVLGTLQYRWIGQMADAERQRMRSGIEFAAHHFSDDFDHELTRIFFAFQMPISEAAPDRLLHRYDEWAASSRDPHVIKSIYFVPPDQLDRIQLVDPSTRSARSVAWPATLAPMRPALAAEIAGGRAVKPVDSRAMALVIPCGVPRVVMERHHAEMTMMIPRNSAARLHDDKVLMLPDMGSSAFTIIQLDRHYIASVLLPDLTHRYFDTAEGRQYEVQVLDPDSGDVLFRSDDRSTPFHADLVLPIFSVRALRREPFDGPMLMDPPSKQAGWQLLVRHHAGSLEEVVGATRRRNLMLTGGILAVLAGTVLALVAMLRSADRFRMQQLEFVAGVTHELNTPVAALTAAGQNLADGIITEPSQVARYGSAIVKESRRLTEMIGQVLSYGGMQARRRLPLVPVDVNAAIDEAVTTCRWMADEQGVVVETHVDRLPLVDGDPASLARAVQNLIANAIRYGAAGKWVAISATVIDGSVVIRVEDRGPGIAARDLPHLFEPFYRGRGADRVRGSGLGLTIVKQIASAHGGSVTAERRREHGAAFTLRLPARSIAEPVPEIAQHA